MTKITRRDIPHFAAGELNPKVLKLLEIIQEQGEAIQQLRDEVARLKKHKARPKIKPSKMEEATSGEKQRKKKRGKRPGSANRSKTQDLAIHETKTIPPKKIPRGSVFKGHKEYVVQDLKIEAHNTLYRLERWMHPSGSYVEGILPPHVEGHYGAHLRAYLLYQHNQCHVTQPRLLEQMFEFGIKISSGQLDRLLSGDKEAFHEEKEELLTAGLCVSNYVQVDDTGARHQGKNGYCTAIGNDFFAWFGSTASKSRMNFLELLRGRYKDYVINEEALLYMRDQRLPPFRLKRLKERRFSDERQWTNYLQKLGVTDTRHRRIMTEGALIGALFHHGFNPDMVIVSDDAGQFNILWHALCWIHAERTIHKLVGFNDDHRADLKIVRSQIWDFYRELKAYKIKPGKRKRRRLEKRFDAIFTQKTGFATLNCALKRLHKNKNELLLVLERPEIPLHNNASETDIREYVTRRKISGGTRHERGKRARDTFTSLKKTCRKLGVSFWDYLLDRIHGQNHVPYLPDLIYQTANA